jgi:hypothetical protein
MARRVRNSQVETRSSRLKLAPRRNPYWTSLNEDLHLGYTRGTGGGKWVVLSFPRGGLGLLWVLRVDLVRLAHVR